MKKLICIIFITLFSVSSVHAEKIGEVKTGVTLMGPDHKIVLDAIDDPSIPGITCWMTSAKTGGLGASFGLAKDKSESSIACRQTGNVGKIPPGLGNGENVVSKQNSFLFGKTMSAKRFVDRKRNTLIYIISSTGGAENGSAKNSVSTVVIRPW